MRSIACFALRLSAAGLASLVGVVPVWASAPRPDDHGPGCTCGKAMILKRMAEAGLSPLGEPMGVGGGGGFGPREALTDTDLLHNDLAVEFVPGAASGDPNIIGSNTMTVRSLVNGLTQFTFMLRSNFTITQVLYDGVTPLTATSVGTYGRRVTLPAALNAGDEFTLRVRYEGVAVSRGFGSIEFTSLGGQPAVFTLSEPYFAATWWPAKDGDFGQPGDHSDKATFDIAITVPSALTVASNGVLQSISAPSGGKRTHRWSTDYPMATYLASVGAAVFNTWSIDYSYPLQGGGTGVMPIAFYISPSSDTPANRAGWERSRDMLAAYRDVYGEYPFVNEKYGIYQFTFGGGMEHQTMTGQSGFGESLTAHELAHQWWGDWVTCRTWNDIWLNEGFATYGEAIWQERKPGSSGLPALHAAMGSRRPSNTAGSVYAYDTSSVGVIFDSSLRYSKGAWVLHGLRKLVGHDTFWDILAAHRAQHGGSAATTDGFFAVASAVAGRDLGPFADAWVYGGGIPTFAFGYQPVTIDGLRYLKLRVRQTQGSPAASAFPARLDVRVTGGAGTTTYDVVTDARTEHFVIPLGEIPSVSAVALDPDQWVLRGTNVSEAFVAGPPVVLKTSPEAGASEAGPVERVSITFSEAITASGANFSVTRGGVPVAFTYGYDAARQTATLMFAQALAGGDYVVRATDAVRSAAGGVALDGEFAGVLPSGEGLPGGAFEYSFSVAGCEADFNSDGFVDFFDFDDFVACFEGAACPPGQDGDFNGDGFVDFFDFDDYISAFEAGC